MNTAIDINDIYPTRWLKANDLGDMDSMYTISDAHVDQIGQEHEEKLVLNFKESPKMLVVNRTNARVLATLFGTKTDAWIGKRITLYSTEVTFGGKTVLGIRIRMRTPKPLVKEPMPEDPPSHWDDDESQI